MRLHRIYYPQKVEMDSKFFIENDRAHYLRNVLRVNAGHRFRLFNHVGKEYLTEIIAVNKKNLEVLAVETIDTISPSKLNITLVQSLSKGERMDYTVQKATELGISTIQPITSEFSEVKLSGKRLEKKLLHWKNISISACEQSFRSEIPQIEAPITITEYCKTNHQGLLLEPEESNTIGHIAKSKWQQFEIAVGPEGGWSQKDLQLLHSTGLTGIQFGQRILRTETVAPAILAAIHSLWGDFV